AGEERSVGVLEARDAPHGPGEPVDDPAQVASGGTQVFEQFPLPGGGAPAGRCGTRHGGAGSGGRGGPRRPGPGVAREPGCGFGPGGSGDPRCGSASGCPGGPSRPTGFRPAGPVRPVGPPDAVPAACHLGLPLVALTVFRPVRGRYPTLAPGSSRALCEAVSDGAAGTGGVVGAGRPREGHKLGEWRSTSTCTPTTRSRAPSPRWPRASVRTL